MNTKDTPYLSFVVAGRNDNYGGDFDYRLQNSIHSLAEHVEKYQLPTEYMIVNYNPKLDRPSLKESLNWPKNRKYLKFRIVTVPAEIHERFNDTSIRETVPLYEYIAKNIGIRRAKGIFINAANPDIIYPERVVKFLAQQNLKKDHYYRADRLDFHRIEVDLNGGGLPSDFIKNVKRSAFRVFFKGHQHPVDFKWFFDWQLKRLRKKNQQQLELENSTQDTPPEFYYHCNCSGDFMLLHKDAWANLRGNPEETLVAAHTDAMFVIMAATSGLKEYVLDTPVYHQDHGRRYTCDDENEVIPSVELMYKRYEKAGRKMMKQGAPIITNNQEWGLKGEELPDEEF